MSRHYTARAGGTRILGAHLRVGHTTLGSSLPYSAARSGQLLRCVETITQSYQEEQGLPVRSLLYGFERGQLLVLCFRSTQLLVLTDVNATLGDIEIAGRKLVTTAHLQAPLAADNPIVIALQTPVHDLDPVAEQQPPSHSWKRWAWMPAIAASWVAVGLMAQSVESAPPAEDVAAKAELQQARERNDAMIQMSSSRRVWQLARHKSERHKRVCSNKERK
jgi:hypothetical protein